ncbi:MAG: RNA polymerase sigma factor [Planctomycetes bacterium]|nr:RNA polymerase sigma factor [Planctomycetota bacterium]MCC7172384.1 RNA polymerase sigma factor [Planctomycetota bacterium]
MTDMDDRDTTQRAIAGDRFALEILWRDHRRWLSAVLLSHMPNGADLEDLLQETAMNVCRKIRDLRDPERLRPWLRTIAINTAISAGRSATLRRKVRTMDDTELDPADPSIDHDEDHATARDTLERVLAAAQRLHPDYREPLILKSVRGLSQRAIAEALDLPETTIETRLARARRMLRQLLEEKGVPVPPAPRTAPGT